VLPIVQELCPVPEVSDALRALRTWPDLVLFDSALQRERLGRYSFLSARPIHSGTLQDATYGADPFAECRELAKQFDVDLVADLPPFQGGFAGVLSYDLGRCWEQLPNTTTDEFQLPAMFWGVYDWVLAWDHQKGKAWLIAHGLDESLPVDRARSATQRIEEVQAQLAASPSDEKRPAGQPQDLTRTQDPTRPVDSIRAQHSIQPADLEFVPQHTLDDHRDITSDFSRADYLSGVQRVIDYIEAGDIFQANLSQRLLTKWDSSPVDLYCRLRECNPAPFAGFVAHDDWAIASASPERFVRVADRVVETRPIKGTRQRRAVPEADLFTRDELRASEKDLAENVMIVDLLRNDLSRVCEPGSISVPQLCVVETYETVQHLVSEIRGTLATDRILDHRSATESSTPDAWTLLAATFPGGSITGAPKVRAMEIIAEIEPTARGPYCGSMFYVGLDGRMDSNILIRTFVCRHGWAQCSVGGGIVAQSNPVAEFEETLHKAAGMLRVFEK
jgi:para-aminobenzoate synthetase component I